jgi:hypothetical protein
MRKPQNFLRATAKWKGSYLFYNLIIMKKLTLNKQTIAQLDNPEKIVGGLMPTAHLIGQKTYLGHVNSFIETCEQGYTCMILSCAGGHQCMQ